MRVDYPRRLAGGGSKGSVLRRRKVLVPSFTLAGGGSKGSVLRRRKVLRPLLYAHVESLSRCMWRNDAYLSAQGLSRSASTGPYI